VGIAVGTFVCIFTGNIALMWKVDRFHQAELARIKAEAETALRLDMAEVQAAHRQDMAEFYARLDAARLQDKAEVEAARRQDEAEREAARLRFKVEVDKLLHAGVGYWRVRQKEKKGPRRWRRVKVRGKKENRRSVDVGKKAGAGSLSSL